MTGSRTKGSLIAVALAAWCATAQGQPLAMKDENGLRWACGGIGVEERQALAELERQANLKLLFVTAKRGGYLADVDVSLYPSGAAGLAQLTMIAQGPICVIDAPPGRYRIEASYNGVKRAATVTLRKDGKRPVQVALTFPEEGWDGIKATDEEKRSSRGATP